MNNEYEFVEHNFLNDIKIFIVELSHRKPHFHKEFEICMVLSGMVEVFCNKHTYLFSDGSVFLFNPRRPHELHTAKGSTVILSLQISSGFCSRFFPDIYNLEFDSVDIGKYFSQKIKFMVQREIQECAYLYFLRNANYEFKCMSLLCDIFYRLLYYCPYHRITELERRSRNAHLERLSRITKFIDENYTSKILLSDLVEAEGLSLSYLSHFFKDNFNMSFQEYVTLLRFEKARYLIAQTDLSLTDICVTCGFSDYRYLSQIFVKKTGMTPKEFRKTGQAGDHYQETEEREAATAQMFLGDAESLRILEKRL